MPLGHRSKAPTTRHGVKDATTDEKVIRTRFSSGDLNVGIACGFAGVCVLDIDPRNGGDETLRNLEREHGRLPRTITVHTGGGGTHYYFRVPEGRKLQNFTGVDGKNRGGYVVAPPSIHPDGGVYEWDEHRNPFNGKTKLADAPEWLLVPAVRAPRKTGPDRTTTKPKDLPAELISEIQSALAVFDCDDYQDWIAAGQALHASGAGETAFEIWDEWSQDSGKYDADATRHKWDNTFRADGGRTLGSLFFTAERRGWVRTLQPLPLTPDVAEPRPYPIECLPSIMRNAAQAIAEHVQAPLALAGQCVIGAVTHLAQTRVNAWDKDNPNGIPVSLFLLTLGDSGDRKSSCRNLAFKTIDEREKFARTEHAKEIAAIKERAGRLKGKSRDEFLEENPLPSDPRTQYSDATFEPIAGDFIRGLPAATWDTDEGGQVLGGHSMKSDARAAVLGGLTQAFDKGRFERTRSHGNLEGSGVAYHRRLSVHLMAQQITVAEALADPLLRGQGFLPRFLFCSPQSIAGTRQISRAQLNRSAYRDRHLQAFWERCERIAGSPESVDPETGEVTPPVIGLSEDAKDAWIDFYNRTEREIGALGQYSDLAAFAGRAGELARRLATVFACFTGLREVDRNTMQNACTLVEYSLSEWRRYTDGARVDPVTKDAAHFMAWVTDPQHFGQWRVFDKTKWGKSAPLKLRPAKLRDRILDVLTEHRYVLTTDKKNYRINPLADSADFAESQTRRGFAVAEDLRRTAENLRIANAFPILEE